MARSPYAVFGAPMTRLTRALEKQPTPVTLRQLLEHGGRPGVPVSSEDLIRSAAFTQRELPIRLARRVRQFYSLPFLVASNPHIQEVARLYAKGFAEIGAARTVNTADENEAFTEMLQKLVLEHAENVPVLSRGFMECRAYMDDVQVSNFLNAALHSRIAIRLIAEQHLALSEAAARAAGKSTDDRYPQSATSVGVIETEMRPADVIRASAEYVHHLCEATFDLAPPLVIEGDMDITSVGVPMHLDYVMTELLKNSFRATTERYLKQQSARAAARATSHRRSRRVLSAPEPPTVEEIEPVVISISSTPSHVGLRIRDRGGGIPPHAMPRIFDYAFTTVNVDGSESLGDSANCKGAPDGDPLDAAAGAMQSGMGSLAGLGYGLPMARLYTGYFGKGTVDIVSLWGYVRMRTTLQS